MPRSSVSFSLTLAAGLALVLGGCDRQSADQAQPPEGASGEITAGGSELTGTLDRSHAGGELPDFTFSDPAGNSLALPSLKGRPVLINLWATWCAPCVVEMPMLDELAGIMGDRLRVLTISQDMQGAEKVAPFFAERNFTHLEQWLDPNVDLSFHYGGGGTVLPTTILYDADGKEVWRMVGGYHWSSDEAVALINDALPGG